MAAYQAQAVDPHVTPLEGMRPAAGLDRSATRRRLRGQRRTPGSARRPDRVDGRLGRRRKRSRSQPIPISTCSTNATARPTRRTSSQRYRAAQVARNNAITDWAEAELKRVRAAGFSDRPFTVLRTWADPRMVDPDARTHQAARQHVLRRRAGQGQPVGPRHRGGLHAAQLARHVEPAARADPGRAAPGPHRLPGAGDQRRAGHRRVPVRRPAHLRRARPAPTRRSARSTPTTTSPRRGPAARRPIRSPSGSRSGRR